ncbi:helix-turn-helix domain-containing protein [Streptomyces sp. P38-E01]|uniref:Helix-turn-helix domain-containing protein n=1 Tax=Streptomyces tardus TaxID=2780544 RepID=A0A949JD09_9ACTN|nr:helix-turn-helix transcriptional regulator [Streptomyces tardus]MBU7597626.1 helix-turn-helix domain-containing protein [Streptomyces tardus]
MAEKATGSTVPRRQLGRHLRELRNKARLTVKAAAQQLEWSEAKMWRIETGQTSLRSHDVALMCQVYGAPEALSAALMGLAKETKARGWWHSYGDVIPEGFDVYIGLEGAAASLATYESDLVPGLLQTPDYARAVIQTLSDEDEEEIERRVRLRVERQTLLTRQTAPPTLSLVLSETALRRPAGSPSVMRAQCEHLVEASMQSNVMIRVVPLSAGPHPGVATGAFVILRFPTTGDGTDTEPPTVYADGYTGSLYLDKPSELEAYDKAFRGIWEAAHDEEASRRLMTEVARSYGQD